MADRLRSQQLARTSISPEAADITDHQVQREEQAEEECNPDDQVIMKCKPIIQTSRQHSHHPTQADGDGIDDSSKIFRDFGVPALFHNGPFVDER